jgi:hypothetical protein
MNHCHLLQFSALGRTRVAKSCTLFVNVQPLTDRRATHHMHNYSHTARDLQQLNPTPVNTQCTRD